MIHTKRLGTIINYKTSVNINMSFGRGIVAIEGVQARYNLNGGHNAG